MKANNPIKKTFELPGKRLSGSITIGYLFLLLVLPLLFLGFALTKVTQQELLFSIHDSRLHAAFFLTIWTAFLAALINLGFGTLIAWVQVRYNYPGKKAIDMLIDLPFALPTSVTGIALTAAFASESMLGKSLLHLEIQVNYTPLGIILAMIFIGIPFVVRQVEPILEELGTEMEQAATLLGATPFQTFKRIILPNMIPPALAGFTAAFARGLGEYGSVIFISGNMPMKTEVVSLLIMSKLEQFNYGGAVIIAVAMLLLSFFFLGLSNALQYYQRKKYGFAEKGA